MSVLESHPTLERLSSYLDLELPSTESREIEDHLEECRECRVELDGLRRVVGGLHAFERISPPPFMETSILQQVSLEAARQRQRRSSFLRIIETSGRGNIALGFAVVLSLAAIVYVFAIASMPETEIVVPSSDSVRIYSDSEGLVAEIAGRTFRRRGADWQEEGALPETGQTPTGETRRAALVAEFPWLSSLLEDSETVWLVDRGETVGLRGSLPER